MTLVAVASLRGSPGATTLATALAGRARASGEPALVVEADPDGGVLAARFDLPLRPCLTDLAGAARRGIAVADLGRFTHLVGPGVAMVVAHPSGEQTSAALRTAAEAVGPALAASEGTVVADLGRWRAGTPAAPVARAAAALVLVVRPVLEQVVPVVHAVDAATDGPLGTTPIGLVLIGSRPYSAREVREATGGVEVLATLPDDPARVLGDPFATSGRRRDAWTAAVDEVRRALAGLTTRSSPSRLDGLERVAGGEA